MLCALFTGQIRLAKARHNTQRITRPCQVWEINASTRSKHLCFRVSVTRLLILEVKFADKDVHWIPKSAVDLPVSFATLRHHRSELYRPWRRR